MRAPHPALRALYRLSSAGLQPAADAARIAAVADRVGAPAPLVEEAPSFAPLLAPPALASALTGALRDARREAAPALAQPVGVRGAIAAPSPIPPRARPAALPPLPRPERRWAGGAPFVSLVPPALRPTGAAGAAGARAAVAATLQPMSASASPLSAPAAGPPVPTRAGVRGVDASAADGARRLARLAERAQVPQALHRVVSVAAAAPAQAALFGDRRDSDAPPKRAAVEQAPAGEPQRAAARPAAPEGGAGTPLQRLAAVAARPPRAAAKAASAAAPSRTASAMQPTPTLLQPPWPDAGALLWSAPGRGFRGLAELGRQLRPQPPLQASPAVPAPAAALEADALADLLRREMQRHGIDVDRIEP